jgi:hypothetical protein
MDPHTKLLLDEMKILGERFTSLESCVNCLGDCVDGLGAHFTGIETKAEEATVWKEEVDSSVADLAAKLTAVEDLASKVIAVDNLVDKVGDVEALKVQISNITARLDRVTPDKGGPMSGILPKPEMVAATPLAGNPAIGPTGHRFDKQLRDSRFGSVLTYTQIPGKGMPTDPPHFPGSQPFPFSSHRFASSSGSATGSTSGHWPKIPFPKFDGEKPKLWQSWCENYFDMSSVDKSNWVRIASMYFDKAAARWLQSIEHRAKYLDWTAFCQLVHDRFGRDQHELLIRQLLHIKQTGSVVEYVEEFSQLVDQLGAYTSHTDPMFYTLRFIDGLRDDIKSIVLVQRPKDLDTACVLASL